MRKIQEKRFGINKIYNFSYVTQASSEPLIIFGRPGCGKSVLSAKVALDVHTWLPDCHFVIRCVSFSILYSYQSTVLQFLNKTSIIIYVT